MIFLVLSFLIFRAVILTGCLEERDLKYQTKRAFVSSVLFVSWWLVLFISIFFMPRHVAVPLRIAWTLLYVSGPWFVYLFSSSIEDHCRALRVASDQREDSSFRSGLKTFLCLYFLFMPIEYFIRMSRGAHSLPNVVILLFGLSLIAYFTTKLLRMYSYLIARMDAGFDRDMILPDDRIPETYRKFHTMSIRSALVLNAEAIFVLLLLLAFAVFTGYPFSVKLLTTYFVLGLMLLTVGMFLVNRLIINGMIEYGALFSSGFFESATRREEYRKFLAGQLRSTRFFSFTYPLLVALAFYIIKSSA